MPEFSTSAALRHMRALLGRAPADTPLDPLPDRWRGEGPVVLVGGLCTTDLALAPLRDRLEWLGYTVTTHTAGGGMGCAARNVAELAEVVRAAADAAGRRVRLLGYSRGGQFARIVAQDPAMPVRSLVTLGTPFDFYGVSRLLLLQGAAIAVAGTFGVRGLASLSCLFGSCCAEFRRALRAPVPVPFAAIYSRRDRMVRWQACLDEAAYTVEVPGSHLGLLSDTAPLRAVAEQLRRCDGPAWTETARHPCVEGRRAG